MVNKHKVIVVGTGGTISRNVEDQLDFHEYMLAPNPRLTVPELLELYPVYHGFDVVAMDFERVPGMESGDRDWLDVCKQLHRMAAENPDAVGAVVTSGTSRLEELAYFLHLTHKLRIPVAVVGSMRPNGVLSSDVALNFLGALRTVASPEAVGLGVLVPMNGQIHSARDVTKGSTMAVDAFQSRALGPLGFVEPNTQGVRIYRRPMKRFAPDTPFSVNGVSSLPRVDINYSHAGSDGTAIEAFVLAGSRGIINAGAGAGAPNLEEYQALLAARDAGVVVVLTTRTGSGVVSRTRKWKDAGFVCGNDLSPHKARVLTMLALANSADEATIVQRFSEF